MWPWSSPIKKKNLVAFPLKLDWPSGLAYDQQNLVKMMMYDFWSRARKAKQCQPWSPGILIYQLLHLRGLFREPSCHAVIIPSHMERLNIGTLVDRPRWAQCRDDPNLATRLLMKEPLVDCRSCPGLVTFNPLEPSSCPGAEANHPQCALFRILTSGTHDYNKKFAILYH